MYQATLIGAIKRVSDGACIPQDPANADYREVLKWIAAGNVLLPVDPAEVQAKTKADSAAVARVAARDKLRPFKGKKLTAADLPDLLAAVIDLLAEEA